MMYRQYPFGKVIDKTLAMYIKSFDRHSEIFKNPYDIIDFNIIRLECFYRRLFHLTNFNEKKYWAPNDEVEFWSKALQLDAELNEDDILNNESERELKKLRQDLIRRSKIISEDFFRVNKQFSLEHLKGGNALKRNYTNEYLWNELQTEYFLIQYFIESKINEKDGFRAVDLAKEFRNKNDYVVLGQGKIHIITNQPERLKPKTSKIDAKVVLSDKSKLEKYYNEQIREGKTKTEIANALGLKKSKDINYYLGKFNISFAKRSYKKSK